MSNEVFPIDLPGLLWNISKAPQYNTKIMRSVNGRELRASFQAIPTYTFELAFEFLRQTNGRIECDIMQAFFHARRGSFDSFLFAYPGDNQVVNQHVGVGDGVTTSFQLVRSLNGLIEPVSNVLIAANNVGMWSNSNSKLMWKADTSKRMWFAPNSYTISAAGLMTFSSPPESGVAITWTGTFYYRCRFSKDSIEFNQFVANFWEAKKIELIGSLGNKI